MRDPFLLSHLIKFDKVFALTGPLHPISIRDQMIRGQLIVDRAIEEGLIDKGNRRLVVFGAGACGATAALRASEHGIQTTLVEKRTTLFSQQLRCRSRTIDPTLYDWPANFWDNGTFPAWPPWQVPLPWQEGLASDVAASWLETFSRKARRLSNLLSVIYSSRGKPSIHRDRNSGLLYVSVKDLNGTPIDPPIMAGMVLLCFGFGRERRNSGTNSDNFSSFSFWDTDLFQTRNLGLRLENTPKVLISGGGDGALQESLRIVTHRSAKEIYKQLKENLPLSPILLQLEHGIMTIEDRARRAHLWGYSKGHDHHIHGNLHRDYIQLMQDLSNGNSNAWGNLCAEMAGIIIKDPPHIDLAHRCDHFSQCYALNRFLVLFLSSFIKDTRGEPIISLRHNLELANIQGTNGHSCIGDHDDCYGQDHMITLHGANCTSKNTSALNEIHNVIIIRHGSIARRLRFKSGREQLRQLLPYHLPS